MLLGWALIAVIADFGYRFASQGAVPVHIAR
jgi:hypothetical protein